MHNFQIKYINQEVWCLFDSLVHRKVVVLHKNCIQNKLYKINWSVAQKNIFLQQFLLFPVYWKAFGFISLQSIGYDKKSGSSFAQQNYFDGMDMRNLFVFHQWTIYNAEGVSRMAKLTLTQVTLSILLILHSKLEPTPTEKY